MKKPKILVAGYGTWAKATANPAEAIALDMGRRDWATCEVLGFGVPVDSAAIAAEIERLLELHTPDAWIGIGVSSAAIVQAEMVGVNWLDFDVPDIDGRTIKTEPIVKQGPAAYNATLPNAQIVDAIKQAGIPAALSFHAGTHLCNQMLYTAAGLIEQSGLSTLSGFIHVPRTPTNVLEVGETRPPKPSMCLSLSSQALVQCIETTAGILQARKGNLA